MWALVSTTVFCIVEALVPTAIVALWWRLCRPLLLLRYVEALMPTTTIVALWRRLCQPLPLLLCRWKRLCQPLLYILLRYTWRRLCQPLLLLFCMWRRLCQPLLLLHCGGVCANHYHCCIMRGGACASHCNCIIAALCWPLPLIAVPDMHVPLLV